MSSTGDFEDDDISHDDLLNIGSSSKPIEIDRTCFKTCMFTQSPRRKYTQKNQHLEIPEIKTLTSNVKLWKASHGANILSPNVEQLAGSRISAWCVKHGVDLVKAVKQWCFDSVLAESEVIDVMIYVKRCVCQNFAFNNSVRYTVHAFMQLLKGRCLTPNQQFSPLEVPTVPPQFWVRIWLVQTIHNHYDNLISGSQPHTSVLPRPLNRSRMEVKKYPLACTPPVCGHKYMHSHINTHFIKYTFLTDATRFSTHTRKRSRPVIDPFQHSPVVKRWALTLTMKSPPAAGKIIHTNTAQIYMRPSHVLQVMCKHKCTPLHIWKVCLAFNHRLEAIGLVYSNNSLFTITDTVFLTAPVLSLCANFTPTPLLHLCMCVRSPKPVIALVSNLFCSA